MLNRPSGRKVTYYKRHTFDDDVRQMDRDRAVYRAENGMKAGRVLDQNPLAQLKSESDIRRKQRQENYDKNPAKKVSVNKGQSVYQRLQRRRLENDQAGEAPKAPDASTWKVTPEKDRKVQRLTPKVQKYGGGYFPNKAKTWSEAVHRSNAETYARTHNATRRQSSLVGVDSPKGQLEMKAAGKDHNAKNAVQIHSLLKTSPKYTRKSQKTTAASKVQSAAKTAVSNAGDKVRKAVEAKPAYYSKKKRGAQQSYGVK